mmetsp:Transcript_5905/g.22918  ORF Transcript_5905/g.22918 Transcript_5905/m.22918 type:complete len:296 (+) Transcript_5905:145-1032(+)
MTNRREGNAPQSLFPSQAGMIDKRPCFTTTLSRTKRSTKQTSARHFTLAGCLSLTKRSRLDSLSCSHPPRCEHLQGCTRTVEPILIHRIQVRGEILIHLRVILVDPIHFCWREEIFDDERLAQRSLRQFPELEELLSRGGAHFPGVLNGDEILNANAERARLVEPRLVAHDHARHQRLLIVEAWRNALRTFVDVERSADSMPGSVCIVLPSSPKLFPGKGVEHEARGAFGKDAAVNLDVPLQDPGERFLDILGHGVLLVLAKDHRARAVRGALAVLAPGVHQQQGPTAHASARLR